MADQTKPLSPLSLAILIALAERELHGYALMRAIEDQTEGALRPGTGTLYAALDRLTADGLIGDAGAEADDRRRGRTYAITAAGQAAARAEIGRLQRVVHLARARDLAPEGGR